MRHHKRDLAILAADKDMEFTLRGLLSRHHSFKIKQITWDVFVHPYRDPGCRCGCVEFMQTFKESHKHVLVVFDREGSGRDSVARTVIETEIEEEFSRSGWSDAAAVVVLDPELEIWVWSDSPTVDEILGWSNRQPKLREELRQQGYIQDLLAKPSRPKEALHYALRLVRKPPSPSIFYELASKVSTRRCKDASFAKLVQTLQRWFPSN